MSSSEAPPAKRIKISKKSFSPPIKVIVGKDTKTKFYIQKGLICAKSKFFEAACNKRWESGRTSTVVLEEDGADEFALFLAWVLTGKIEDAEEYKECVGTTTVEQEEAAHAQFAQLCRCYVLGDALQSEEFCNCIINMVVAKSEEIFIKYDEVAGALSTSFSYVYSNTTSNSPLRKVIVDLYCSYLCLEDDPMIDFKQVEVPEFYYELSLLAMKKYRKDNHALLEDAPWNGLPCHYHRHTGEPEGYTC